MRAPALLAHHQLSLELPACMLRLVLSDLQHHALKTPTFRFLSLLCSLLMPNNTPLQLTSFAVSLLLVRSCSC